MYIRPAQVKPASPDASSAIPATTIDDPTPKTSVDVISPIPLDTGAASVTVPLEAAPTESVGSSDSALKPAAVPVPDTVAIDEGATKTASTFGEKPVSVDIDSNDTNSEATPVLMVERNGNFELVNASEVDADLDAIGEADAVEASPSKQLSPRAQSARSPSKSDNVKLKQRPKSAAATASSALQKEKLTVPHSPGFKGPPGCNLTRFKSAAARDSWESWYNSRTSLSKSIQEKEKQLQREEDAEAQKAAEAAYTAWKALKDKEANGNVRVDRQAKREAEKQKLVDTAEKIRLAEGGYQAWCERKKEDDAKKRREAQIRAELLAPEMQIARKQQSEQAVKDWKERKRKEEAAKAARFKQQRAASAREMRRITQSLNASIGLSESDRLSMYSSKTKASPRKFKIT